MKLLAGTDLMRVERPRLCLLLLGSLFLSLPIAIYGLLPAEVFCEHLSAYQSWGSTAEAALITIVIGILALLVACLAPATAVTALLVVGVVWFMYRWFIFAVMYPVMEC